MIFKLLVLWSKLGSFYIVDKMYNTMQYNDNWEEQTNFLQKPDGSYMILKFNMIEKKMIWIIK